MSPLFLSCTLYLPPPLPFSPSPSLVPSHHRFFLSVSRFLCLSDSSRLSLPALSSSLSLLFSSPFYFSLSLSSRFLFSLSLPSLSLSSSRFSSLSSFPLFASFSPSLCLFSPAFSPSSLFSSSSLFLFLFSSLSPFPLPLSPLSLSSPLLAFSSSSLSFLFSFSLRRRPFFLLSLCPSFPLLSSPSLLSPFFAFPFASALLILLFSFFSPLCPCRRCSSLAPLGLSLLSAALSLLCPCRLSRPSFLVRSRLPPFVSLLPSACLLLLSLPVLFLSSLSLLPAAVWPFLSSPSLSSSSLAPARRSSLGSRVPLVFLSLVCRFSSAGIFLLLSCRLFIYSPFYIASLATFLSFLSPPTSSLSTVFLSCGSFPLLWALAYKWVSVRSLVWLSDSLSRALVIPLPLHTGLLLLSFSPPSRLSLFFSLSSLVSAARSLLVALSFVFLVSLSLSALSPLFLLSSLSSPLHPLLLSLLFLSLPLSSSRPHLFARLLSPRLWLSLLLVSLSLSSSLSSLSSRARLASLSCSLFRRLSLLLFLLVFSFSCSSCACPVPAAGPPSCSPDLCPSPLSLLLPLSSHPALVRLSLSSARVTSLLSGTLLVVSPACVSLSLFSLLLLCHCPSLFLLYRLLFSLSPLLSLFSHPGTPRLGARLLY
ncbi:hypothetical protein C7M84_021309 [Penaeus vannamei]|uniref:Uncharacterized protein n=1 Tax=Penaeus vannamei TaxID=6689 RepID=A0A3R7P4G5_PENVA|nr:hypothetical protein C7M84_021309 [Penaeus vannamei]